MDERINDSKLNKVPEFPIIPAFFILLVFGYNNYITGKYLVFILIDKFT